MEGEEEGPAVELNADRHLERQPRAISDPQKTAREQSDAEWSMSWKGPDSLEGEQSRTPEAQGAFSSCDQQGPC